jgi:hypothetical protein
MRTGVEQHVQSQGEVVEKIVALGVGVAAQSVRSVNPHFVLALVEDFRGRSQRRGDILRRMSQQHFSLELDFRIDSTVVRA